MSLLKFVKSFSKPRCSQLASFSTETYKPSSLTLVPKDTKKSTELEYKKSAAEIAEIKAKTAFDSAKPFSEIPGPQNFPFVKSHWIFFPKIGYVDVKSIENFYGILQKKFGPLIKLNNNLVLGLAPEYVRAMHKNEGVCPHRPGMESLIKYRQDRPDIYKYTGPFTAQGWMWNEMRMKAMKYFYGSQFDCHLPHIEEVSDDVIKYIKVNRDIRCEIEDFIQVLFKWSIESIGNIALDRRFGCIEKHLSPYSEGSQLIKLVRATLETLHDMESGLQLYTYFETKAYKRLAAAQDEFHAKILSYMEECQEHINNVGPRIPQNKGRVALVDTLLVNGKMESAMVLALVSDMFFAGVDTVDLFPVLPGSIDAPPLLELRPLLELPKRLRPTAIAMTFILYHLARNPEKQQNLRKAINDQFQKGVPITNGNAMLENKYLQATIKESFRMNPVTVGTGRVMPKECAIGGYRIPAGVTVAGITVQIGRNPDFFDRPFEFIPERHLSPEERLAAGCQIEPPQFSIKPFGFAKRMCLGRRIAELELSNLLIKIMQNFEVEYYHQPIDNRVGLTMVPNAPVHLVFKDLK